MNARPKTTKAAPIYHTSHLVLQCLRDGVVSGVVEVNLAPLYGHRTASSYLGGKLYGVVHQQLPAHVHKINNSSFSNSNS